MIIIILTSIILPDSEDFTGHIMFPIITIPFTLICFITTIILLTGV